MFQCVWSDTREVGSPDSVVESRSNIFDGVAFPQNDMTNVVARSSCVDLPRFDSASLIGILAIKENSYGKGTQRRIQT